MEPGKLCHPVPYPMGPGQRRQVSTSEPQLLDRHISVSFAALPTFAALANLWVATAKRNY